MYRLNRKIKELEPYKPISGSYKIRLDANESCFSLPKDMLDKIHTALNGIDFNRYPDPAAAKTVAAFADYYGLNAELVTAGNGSDELISVLMMAFLMKDDAVVTVVPDFSMYSFYAAICEGKCIDFKKNDDLSIDVDRLIDTVNSNNAAMLIFSNPCNPTSKGLTKQELRKIIKSVNSLVVLDEAYMDFWDESLLNEVDNYDNLIILRTASKAIGAASIRLGFAIANKTLTRALRAVKSPYNVNSVTQEIGRIIYQDKTYLENVKNKLICLRTGLYNELKRLEAEYPEYMQVFAGNSNFVFIKTGIAEKLYKYLLSESIAIRFMGDYIRITTGTESENEELLIALRRFFKTELI